MPGKSIHFLSVINFDLQERKQRAAEGDNTDYASTKKDGAEERVITLRPLNMEDFRQAKNQVTP